MNEEMAQIEEQQTQSDILSTPEERAEFNQIWDDQREAREATYERDRDTLAQLQSDQTDPAIIQLYEFRVDMQTDDKEREFGAWLEMTREYAQQEQQQQNHTHAMKF